MSTSHDTTIQMKRCTKCGNEYPATAEYFNRCVRNKSGLRAECNNCRWVYRQTNKDAEAVRSRRHRQLNQTRIAEYQHNYYVHNKEHLSEYQREYYRENRTRLIVKSRLNRHKNTERYKQTKRIYQQKHRERLASYYRAYRESNRHVCKASTHRYRARKRELPNAFTAYDWQCALEYFGGCCAVCGKPADSHITIAADHWIPLSHPECTGTLPTNIVPLCHGAGGCNNTKRNRLPADWLTDYYGKDKATEIIRRIQAYFDSL
jgi:hypothetical protein